MIPGLGTRTGSTLYKSTARHETNDEITHFRLLVRLKRLAKRSDGQEIVINGSRVFNDFIDVVKSYTCMEVSSETSDFFRYQWRIRGLGGGGGPPGARSPPPPPPPPFRSSNYVFIYPVVAQYREVAVSSREERRPCFLVSLVCYRMFPICNRLFTTCNRTRDTKKHGRRSSRDGTATSL